MLQVVLNKLSSLPPLIKPFEPFPTPSKTRIYNTEVLSLFHMLKALLVLAPSYDKVWLAKATKTLSVYYMQPAPIGTGARELLIMLLKETVAPGYNMRWVRAAGG